MYRSSPNSVLQLRCLCAYSKRGDGVRSGSLAAQQGTGENGLRWPRGQPDFKKAEDLTGAIPHGVWTWIR